MRSASEAPLFIFKRKIMSAHIRRLNPKDQASAAPANELRATDIVYPVLGLMTAFAVGSIIVGGWRGKLQEKFSAQPVAAQIKTVRLGAAFISCSNDSLGLGRRGHRNYHAADKPELDKPLTNHSVSLRKLLESRNGAIPVCKIIPN